MKQPETPAEMFKVLMDKNSKLEVENSGLETENSNLRRDLETMAEAFVALRILADRYYR